MQHKLHKESAQFNLTRLVQDKFDLSYYYDKPCTSAVIATILYKCCMHKRHDVSLVCVLMRQAAPLEDPEVVLQETICKLAVVRH